MFIWVAVKERILACLNMGIEGLGLKFPNYAYIVNDRVACKQEKRTGLGARPGP